MFQHPLKQARPFNKKVISYDHKLAPMLIRNELLSIIPANIEHIYIAGIGSNLINGDSLGPFVGTLLENIYCEHLTIIGSLQSPLDAQTLTEQISHLSFSPNSFVIAVDSVLGPKNYVNTIVIRDGALLPGEGLGQNLPAVGDCSVMGVVLEDNPALESSLFYTNLHMIYTMALTIARGISLAVRQYFHYPLDQPILIANH